MSISCRSVVYRLHTLRDSKHDHDEKHSRAVEYTVGSDRKVAGITAIVEQRFVDEHYYDTGAHTHQKRRHADSIDAACY